MYKQPKWNFTSIFRVPNKTTFNHGTYNSSKIFYAFFDNKMSESGIKHRSTLSVRYYKSHTSLVTISRNSAQFFEEQFWHCESLQTKIIAFYVQLIPNTIFKTLQELVQFLDLRIHERESTVVCCNKTTNIENPNL